MISLCIESLRQSLCLGCTAEERAFPQVVTINIALQIGVPQSIKSDSIKDTVDYIAVVQAVERLAREGSWRLLEKLCFDLVSEFFAAFPLVQSADVSVRKNIVPHTEGISAKLALSRKEWQEIKLPG